MAQWLYTHLAQDGSLPGIRRGIGVPVFFRSTPARSGSAKPAPIHLDQAEHSVVVALVDRTMVEAADQGWEEYFASMLPALTDNGPHRLLPVAFSRAALGWGKAFGPTQAISLRPETPRNAATPEEKAESEKRAFEITARQNGNVLHDISHELARLLLNKPRVSQASTAVTLSKAPVTLFLSHAKRDGEDAIQYIRLYIAQHTSLNTFFDRTSIGSGSDFSAELLGNVDGAAILVLLTDYYASRPWCQREVLRAKQIGRPVLVVDALKLGEARSFPYLGNTPTVRWRDGEAGLEAAIGYLLREVLRAEYFKRYIASLQEFLNMDGSAHALPYPPELLTAVERKKRGPQAPLYIYPDPPIGAAEAELLADFDSSLRWSTPTLLLSDEGEASSRPRIKGLRIGLSISESPDMEALGFGKPHLDDAFAEISRHLLAAGATLATGHDLRSGGFGEALIQLAQGYFADFEKQVTPIHSYLGWSARRTLDEERREDWVHFVKFHLGKPPTEPEPPADSLEHACWRARGYSAMRAEMNDQIDARVILGGRIEGATGPIPGIVEEAWLALAAGKAIYLAGAFGGATRDVLDLLRGRGSPRLTKQWQLENLQRRPIIEAWDRWAPVHGLAPVEFGPPVPVDPGEWWKALKNGLDKEENEALAETIHIPEMVALITRGLRRVAEERAGTT